MGRPEGIVLSLCDFTGVMVEPWVEAGYGAVIVDLRHPKGETQLGNTTTIGCDILRFDPPPWKAAIVFAFPPCTHLAASGARWWKPKGLKALIQGLVLVERCRELCAKSDAPWMIENPVGRLSTCWRKPDYYFSPCEYAGYLEHGSREAYTKKTCLWIGGGFIMPEKKPVRPIGMNPIHRMSPSPDRGFKRSITPRGFAEAVFQANSDNTALSERGKGS